MLTPPKDVVIETAALPWPISSAKIEDADMPVNPEPSPVIAVAATVPATVKVPFERVIRSVSSACPI